MNHLYVTASFEPGHVRVTRLHANEGSRWVALKFDPIPGPELSIHLTSPEQITELEAALQEAREHLSDHKAARDAA